MQGTDNFNIGFTNSMIRRAHDEAKESMPGYILCVCCALVLRV
jgi:hypothetical protein